MDRDHEDDHRGDEAASGARHEVVVAYESTSVPMCGLSWPELEFVSANAAYRALSGRTSLIGRSGRELFPELAGQRVFEMLERAGMTGERRVFRDWRTQAVDGSGAVEDLYFDVVIDPVVGPDGLTTRLQTAVLDVTARTRAKVRAEGRASSDGRRLSRALDTVLALQSALLPEGLPVLPMVDVAASYRLADDDLGAGGDWFDALALDDGRVGLVVGDVVGHGVDASAVMGQLRAVLSSSLLADQGVLPAVRVLDRYASRLPGARAATVVVAVLDPATGDLEYCTAGHPPPLLVAEDGRSTYLERTGGGPLATGSRFASGRHRLDPGDSVMLFSDGLVERPGTTPAESMVEITRVASDAALGRGPVDDAPRSSAGRIATWCVELLTRETGTPDDVTVIVAQRRREPARDLTVDVSAVPDALRVLRDEIGAWSDLLELGNAMRLVLQHGIHELVANAVEHAYSHDERGIPGRVRVSATVSAHGAIEIVVADDGSWRDDVDTPAADRGRGLALVGMLLDRVEVVPGAEGTVVRASIVPAREADLGAPPGSRSGRARTTFGATVRDDRVVEVSGAVDMLSGEELRRVLMRASNGGASGVVVDLSEVTLLGSVAISVLAQPWAGATRLYAPMGSTAQHVLDLVGIDYVSTLPAGRGGHDGGHDGGHG